MLYITSLILSSKQCVIFVYHWLPFANDDIRAQKLLLVKRSHILQSDSRSDSRQQSLKTVFKRLTEERYQKAVR